MAVEDTSTPAGAGRAAAAFLHELEGGKDASQCPPQPSSPSKKSRSKKKAQISEGTADPKWMNAFRGLAEGCKEKVNDEVLTECAKVAQRLEPKAAELCELASKAGLDVNDLGRAVCKLLFFEPTVGQERSQDQECDDLQIVPKHSEGANARKGTKILQLAEESLRTEPKGLLSQRSTVCMKALDSGEEEEEEEGAIMTDKYSYKMAAEKSEKKRSAAQAPVPATRADDPHPLYEAMVDFQGEVQCLEEALQETPAAALQAPLDEGKSIPSPLFYAVGHLKSPGVVKLLLQSQANPRARFSMSSWGIFEKGMTALEAVQKHQSTGDFRMQAIGDLLRQSQEKLGQGSEQLPSKARPRSLSFSGHSGGLHLQSATSELLLGQRSEPLGPGAIHEEYVVQQSVDAATFKRLGRRHSHMPVVRRMSLANRRPSLVRPIIFCKHVDGHPSQMYEMGKQIGAGTFGTVWKAKHTQTGQLHAIKSCPKKLIPSDELWAEIDIMKQLDHPHIMRLYYTFEDEQCIFIASELCEGGELFNAMIEAGALNEQTAVLLFKQIMSAVSYIHMNMVCHRDLKPENFLISKKCEIKDSKVKLIDFGTAKRFDLHPLTTKVCTVHYVAPEVLKKSMDPYTEKVDVWSAGVVLFVMLAGTPPFHSDDDVELMKKVKKAKWEFKPEKAWRRVSESGKELVSSMLTKEVDARPHSAEVLAADWFRQEVAKQDTKVDEDNLTQMRTFVAQSRLKKVALQIIARQISDDTIEKLRGIFLSLDDDHSGTLSVEEIDDALERLEVEEPIRIEMRRLMHEIDVDGSGTVNYTEFIAANISKKQYLQEQVCKAAFHIFDVNGDGFICKNDLAALLKSGHDDDGFAGISVDEINSMMNEVDQNGDGRMSFEEFMALMADRKEPKSRTPDEIEGT